MGFLNSTERTEEPQEAHKGKKDAENSGKGKYGVGSPTLYSITA